MAYTTSTLNLVPGGLLEGNFKQWVYVTTDSYATVIGASYVTDAIAKGMAKGDVVLVVNQTTPTVNRLQVQSVTATAATLGDSGTIIGGSSSSPIGFYGTAAVSQAAALVAVSTSAPIAACATFGLTSTQLTALVTAVNSIETLLHNLGLAA